MSSRLLIAAAATLLASAATPAAAGMALVGYKAVFDLALAPGAELPGIANVAGRSVTEFRGSECAGYSTEVRFVTRTTTEQGKAMIDDIRASTFESTDGYFEFENNIYANQSLASNSVGIATRADGAASVSLSSPEERTIALPADVVFPTEQVMRVIEAAVAGERFVAFPLYDGTDDGESYYQTSTVIGAASTTGGDLGAETVIADAGFEAMRHWPVKIGYFKTEAVGDETPAFTMSLVLYENGLTRDLKLDYGSYQLVGKLTHLEVLPTEPCEH